MKHIKLQVGKTYRNREGEEVKIVGMGNKGWDYWEGSNGEWYYEGGKWSYVTKEHPEDLIEEVKEVTETRHTFDIPDGVKKVTVGQVGDRIIVEMVPEERKEPKPGDVMSRAMPVAPPHPKKRNRFSMHSKKLVSGGMWSREQVRCLIEDYLKHREGKK